MTAEATRVDRRHLRRRQTIEEIVEVAVAVMTEQGVGGLSLGEVARRMGLRTPSLYGYFDGKHALYDAVFAQGWRSVLEVMTEHYRGLAGAVDLPAYLLQTARVFLRWLLEHPVHAELMSWRPVPGYEPTAEAFEPAVATLSQAHGVFQELARRGLFPPEADTERLLRIWIVLLSGVMTQQLANAPAEPPDSGRFTSLLPDLVAMFLAQYGQRPT